MPTETAVPELLAKDLHWLMARAARGLGVLAERAVQPHGLTTRGYVVLAVLADGDQHNQIALGQAAAFDKSTVVRVLDDLESNGLVRRSQDPADRRVRNVSMTAKGRRALAVAQRSVARMQDALLADIPPARRQEVLEAILVLGTGASAATFDTRPVV